MMLRDRGSNKLYEGVNYSHVLGLMHWLTTYANYVVQKSKTVQGGCSSLTIATTTINS